MCSGPDWSRRLSRAVVPIRGDPMFILADARNYILALPSGIRHQDEWQHTAKLLIAAAESGGGIGIEEATLQLERAIENQLSFES
jgi:hypothetical protein